MCKPHDYRTKGLCQLTRKWSVGTVKSYRQNFPSDQRNQHRDKVGKRYQRSLLMAKLGSVHGDTSRDNVGYDISLSGFLDVCRRILDRTEQDQEALEHRYLSASNVCFSAPACPDPGHSNARIPELRRCRAPGHRAYRFTTGAFRISVSHRGPSRGWPGKYGRLASAYTNSGGRRGRMPGLLHSSCLEGDTTFCGNSRSVPPWTSWACEYSTDTIGTDASKTQRIPVDRFAGGA